MQMADDASGDQPGDLHACDYRAFVRLDHNRITFVFAAGLVKIGVEEFAGLVVDRFNLSADRAAVGVNIKDIHKSRNQDFFLACVRILDLLNLADAAVGARKHAVRRLADLSRRIAEELNNKNQDDPKDKGDKASDEPPN